MLRVIDCPSSGTKIFFFWIFTYRRRFPPGLNCVARVRLEYVPPFIELFCVIAQTFDIAVILA